MTALETTKTADTREDQVTEARLYTAEELLALSAAAAGRYGLIEGKLAIISPAGRNHGKLALRVGAKVQLFVEEHDLGEAYAAETGFKLTTDPDTVLAPDAAFVAKARLSDSNTASAYFPGPPDLVVEVVSPSERVAEVQRKIQAWLTHGVKLVWVVEPESKSVNVYRADGSGALLTEDAVLDGEDVLPGFTLALEALFR